MKKFITYIALGIVVVIGIGMFLYMGGSSTSRVTNTNTIPVSKTILNTQSSTGVNSVSGRVKQNSSAQTTTRGQTSIGATSSRAGFTMAQVAQHNSQNSCYTAINGNVYDLTSFIDAHPGGAGSILSLCGVDGTTAFMNMHGGQGRPEAELASLKIGALVQ